MLSDVRFSAAGPGGWLRWFLAAVLALSLAGCSVGGDSIYQVKHYRANALDVLSAGGGEVREIATIVAGNPFGARPETLVEVVANGLENAFPGADIRFVTEPGRGRRGLAAVVVFDAPPGMGMMTVCAREGAVFTGPVRGDFDMMIVFCYAGTTLAGIRGRFERGGGLGARDVSRLVSSTVMRLVEEKDTGR